MSTTSLISGLLLQTVSGNSTHNNRPIPLTFPSSVYCHQRRRKNQTNCCAISCFCGILCRVCHRSPNFPIRKLIP
jgi:hypothetical protein